MPGRSRWVAVAVCLAVGAFLVLVFIVRPDQATDAPQAEPGSGDRRDQPEAQAARLVHLTYAQQQQVGVKTAPAGRARIKRWLTIPGEVTLNADRVAHLVPRAAGVVKEVRKSVGDSVRQGEVLAALESRELADARSAFLAARQRLSLAEVNLQREEQLWRKRISAEQDYLTARNSVAEVGIELEASRQKLRVLGLTVGQVDALETASEQDLTHFELVAPFDATVIEKHADLGEAVRGDESCFMVADLSSVWVLLDLQQKDLARVRVGDSVTITGGEEGPEASGRVSFIDPMVVGQTRTIHARVVLSNSSGQWRPGAYVTGRVIAESFEAGVAVPDEAIILLDGRSHVFVGAAQEFRPQEVVTGRTGAGLTEILSGLAAGQAYVARGAFTLKSELDKPKAEE